MDTLGEILDLLHLTSTLHWRTHLFAPWGLRMEATADMVFHIVEQGACWLYIAGVAAPLPLNAGDFVVLPHGTAHLLVADRATAPEFIYQVQFSTERGCQVLANTGTGAAAAVLCGVFRYERGDGPPLADLLPPVICCPQRDNGAITGILHLLAESAHDDAPGATLIQSRLSDLLFIHAMRVWLAADAHVTNWLSALRDPQIGQALGLMHRQPAQTWTVATLAAAVGLSRSAFSARFSTFVGQAPARYLATWRITQAARELRRTNAPLADIGVRAGYATVAAFSKAFKQMVGLSPRAYRAAQRHGAGDDDRQP